MHELISNHRQLHKIAKLYLAIQFCQALYFAWPVFYGFATQALTPLQVGIYFSVYAIVKVLAEVPTGAFADKFGRKRSAVIGAFALIAVPLIMYFGHTFEAYLACAFLLGISGAFMSGSIEAMVYDHPGVSKEQFRHIIWLEITFFQVGLITSAGLGGFLYAAHPSLPFFGEALAWIIAFLLILLMPEAKPSATGAAVESYGRYFKTGLSHLLASKFLKIVVLTGVLVAVIMTACIEFVNEAAMISYGLEPSERGLLIAGVKVLALIIINLILLKLLRKDRTRLLFIGLMGTAIFALLSVEALAVFFIGFIIFNWLSATQYSFFKPIIHDRLPSSHRATAMSGFSALTGFVAFGGNALFGALIQHFKTPRAVYLVSAAIFVVVIIPCIMWLARHLKTEAAVNA
jgi:MFS family permease